jgi:hypothetical protein
LVTQEKGQFYMTGKSKPTTSLSRASSSHSNLSTRGSPTMKAVRSTDGVIGAPTVVSQTGGRPVIMPILPSRLGRKHQ